MIPIIDDAMNTFYQSILDNEDTAYLLDGLEINHLKKLQKKHWQLTFENGFNTDYFNRMDRIVGVIAALVIGFTGHLLLSRRKIQAQEIALG